MGDRAFLLLVAATALTGTVVVAVVLEPHVPADALESAAGRVVQLAALGFGTAGAFAGVLQVLQMYRTQSAQDVSRGFLAMLTCSFVAWLAYGIALGDLVLQSVNVLGFTVTGTTLAYAQLLHRRSRRGHIAALHPR